MDDDDEEGGFDGLYEHGHWDWEESTKEIVFISDIHPELFEETHIPTKVPTGTIDFRADVDPFEQLRFRRRYQRKLKPGQADVITVQDIKDIAIYTAPLHLLSPQLLSMLHIPTTERFIRALVLCIQYYLQVGDEMANRILALQTKIRTPQSEIAEREFRDNLSDLRLLVAKEYSTVIIGGSDTKKFHHMGPQKKRRSLSDKDARFFETFLRMCVQIVWLALGRIAFNQIELEVNRIFKSEIFNSVEHRLHTNYISNMTKEEREVFLGCCLRHDKKLNARSPLINEVFCSRDFDYRMMGIGVIKFSKENPRLLFLKDAIAGPEETLAEQGITIGIIGMPRSRFDTMLNPLPTATDTKSKLSTSSSMSHTSRVSSVSVKKSQAIVARKVYPDIVLPEKESRMTYYPPSFSEDSEEIRPCNEVQHKKWQKRLRRLSDLHKNH